VTPRPWASAAPAAFAALALLLHLGCGGRYGFFRDELYFVACGKQLAWGYVDQPPLAPLLARVAWWLSGDGASVLRFRLPVALVHAGTVLLAGALARRLGGGGFAAALAAAVVAVAPIHLAQGHLVSMNALELLLWAGVALCAATAAEGRPRAWLAAGLLLGLAMLAKYSGALLAVSLLGGLLATRGRAQLRSPWLWGGVAVAAALALPAALWQLEQGLPFVELWQNGRAWKNAPVPVGAVLGEALLLLLSPLGGLLVLLGLHRLLRSREAAGTRFLGAGLGLLLLAFLALGAKPYYLAPAMTPLLAAGAVALERATARAWVRGLVLVGAVAFALPGAPLALPILSPEATAAWQERLGVRPQKLERMAYGGLPQHLADQLGWPGQVAAVTAVVEALPAADRAVAVLFAPNYGRAAALQLLGRDLPPVISGHNQYFLWGVPGDPRVVVAVGGRAEDYRRDFAEVLPVAETPEAPWAMPYESRVQLYVLRGPRAPLAELLRSAKHYE
jgi:4-amino-4-deoxy-L-arabinose transferase-like glycosyltransferase